MKPKIKKGRPPSRKRIALDIARDGNVAAQARLRALLAAEKEGASQTELVATCWRILGEIRVGVVKARLLEKLEQLEALATDEGATLQPADRPSEELQAVSELLEDFRVWQAENLTQERSSTPSETAQASTSTSTERRGTSTAGGDSASGQETAYAKPKVTPPTATPADDPPSKPEREEADNFPKPSGKAVQKTDVPVRTSNDPRPRRHAKIIMPSPAEQVELHKLFRKALSVKKSKEERERARRQLRRRGEVSRPDSYAFFLSLLLEWALRNPQIGPEDLGVELTGDEEARELTPSELEMENIRLGRYLADAELRPVSEGHQQI